MQVAAKFLESNPNPMWVYDPVSLRIFMANESACREYGYTQDEFSNLTLLDLRPESERAKFLASRDPHQDGAVAGVWVHLRKDGSIRFADITSVRTVVDGKEARIVVALDAHERLIHDHTLDVFFETSLDLLAICNSDGTPIRVSPALTRMLGWTPDQLAGKRLSDFIHPDDRGELESIRSTLAEGRDVVGFTVKYLHADGGHRMVQWNIRPDLASGLIYSVARNVTDQLEIEARLRENQARLIQAQRIASIGDWTYDSDANGFVWSETLWELLGGEPKDGAVSWDEGSAFIHPDDREAIRAYYAAAIENGRTIDVEFRIVRPDGGVRYLHDLGIIERDDDGRVLRAGGTTQDVTESKLRAIELARQGDELRDAIALNAALLEELQHHNVELEDRIRLRTAELETSERRHRILAEMAPQVVWEASPAGDITFIGQLWCAWTGMPLESALGSNIADQFHPDDRERVITAWAESLRTGRRMVVEHRLRRGDGSYMTVEAVAEPIAGPDGKPELWVGVTSDITERKRVERKMRLTQAELIRANRELESFSYSVAHDIRAPLRGIHGFSEILIEDFGATIPDEAKRYVERITSQTVKIEGLIDDLLALARVTRAEPKFVEVDLSAIVCETMAELHGDGVVIIEPGMRLVTDVSLIRLIFTNLATNAWKFTRKTLAPRIEIGRMGPNQFFVRDNGCGFNPGYASKLFEPFQRLHSERDYAGTGIGLAIVKRAVERLGGSISGDGRIGEGATFVVTIPQVNHAE